MPIAVITSAITFVIAFMMRIPQEQTIAASALTGVLVFSGFLFRSFGKDSAKHQK